jgi:sulfhydrogenase subunit alpha
MSEIVIEPLSRVEGDGGITIRTDGHKVKDVHFDILEGTRLIETLVVGKTPEEDVSIICRICAICTLSHRYAALRGLEKALGIEVPPKAQAMRTLMHLGEVLESNSLHVFLLALPDFLGYPSAIAMAEKYGDDVLKALALKKFANGIMAVTSGRIIHGENPAVGGFGKYPGIQTLLDIKQQSQEMIPIADRAVELLAGIPIPELFECETVFMCCEPDNNEYGLVGDRIRISTGQVVPVEQYKELTNEKFVGHSAAKHCLFQGKPYTVGAIARMNNLGERLGGRAGKWFKKHWNKRWLANPVFNNLAQAIEMVWALEQVPKIVDTILKYKEDPEIMMPTRNVGEGVGAVEAPRGVLYHSYRIQDGLVAAADLIIPTGQNLEDIEKYLRKSIEALLSKGADDKTIRSQSEIIARAYDPCISCSTHLVKIERETE